jgi:hypothetical protein
MSAPPDPEIADARARLSGVLKKLNEATDPDDIAYLRLCAAGGRKYIERLEAKSKGED